MRARRWLALLGDFLPQLDRTHVACGCVPGQQAHQFPARLHDKRVACATPRLAGMLSAIACSIGQECTITCFETHMLGQFPGIEFHDEGVCAGSKIGDDRAVGVNWLAIDPHGETRPGGTCGTHADGARTPHCTSGPTLGSTHGQKDYLIFPFLDFARLPDQ